MPSPKSDPSSRAASLSHPWEVTVGGIPHRAATLPTQLSEDLGPIDPPPHHDSVQGSGDSTTATKLSKPENWDRISDLSTEDYACYAGCNDWEDSWTAVAFMFGTSSAGDLGRHTKRVWGHITLPPEPLHNESAAAKPRDHGRQVVESWVAAAKALKEADQAYRHRAEHFSTVACMVMGLRGYGVDKVEWTAAGEGVVIADDTDPQNDSGKNAPVSPNPAPPAAPFPAKVAPKSSQPPGGAPEGGGDDSDKPIPPDPEDPTGPGTSDEGQEEYVGGHLTTEWIEAAATSKCPICGGPPVSSCRCIGPHTMEMLAAGHGKTCAKKHRWSGRIAYCMASGTGTVVAEPRLDPKPLPNPDGGGLAPNPDNATYIPGRTSEDADSFDQGKKPNLDDCVWLLGKKGVALKVDRQTGLARWPIETSQVQRDFNPPNKTVDRNVEPNAPRGQDSEYIGDTDKPYQTGSPPI